MSSLFWGALIDNETMMYIWIVALIIFLIICFTSIVSKRIVDNEESFRRNFKIGMAQTLGGITMIFFLWVIITTIIFFQKLMIDNNDEISNTSNYQIKTK